MTSTSPPPPGPSLAPHPPGVQVLIPQHIPGPIYYPPCKCDMMNQVSFRDYIVLEQAHNLWNLSIIKSHYIIVFMYIFRKSMFFC